jgi:homocysteine S-methyltransferase
MLTAATGSINASETTTLPTGTGSVQSFDEVLRKHVIVGDGAMGSLVARDLQKESPLATARSILDANLSHPEIIQSIHMSYIGAGANLITTNSFGASRARLERLGLREHATAVLSAAVKIARDAREASGQPVWIAGSISPLDTDWLLDTNPSLEQQRTQFEEQASVLLERGADLILLETFSRLDELLLAIEAVRHHNASTPIVAHMTFDEHGEMASGENGETAARRIHDTKQVQAMGVNCSLGPQASLEVLESLAPETDLPLSIMPNAGFAQRLGGRVLYPDMSRSYWETFAKGALQLGVRMAQKYRILLLLFKQAQERFGQEINSRIA